MRERNLSEPISGLEAMFVRSVEKQMRLVTN